ncbi:MAG: hypothetical protein FWE91_00505 [Defluviitaleaceae bacterium]|nr:hypothetical protein [Defluviitaleaceae bacterium]MCL2835469.1 hypothetical protein [Defluviitaleaceae bacterium]
MISNINSGLGAGFFSQGIGGSGRFSPNTMMGIGGGSSPWYMMPSLGINTSQTLPKTREYVSGIKQMSNQLLKAANEMASGHMSKLNQVLGSSSNNNVVGKVEARPTANANKPIDLNVAQTASGQVNTGNSVSSEGNDLSVGMNSIRIESGGRMFAVNVNVTASDDNESAVNKIADAINRSGAGLNAAVTTNEKTGESSITIESRNTGAGRGFTISDVSGNAVSALGLDNVTTQARNAIYSVNGGVNRESATNSVFLGNGVNAELEGTGQTRITAKADTGAALDAVKDMLKSYNDLLRTARSFDSTGSDRISERLTGAARMFSASLNSVGISADRNGFLTLDETRASRAVESGAMQHTMRPGGGFMSSVSQTARAVDSNPNQFIGWQRDNEQSGFSFNSFLSNNLFGNMTGLGLLFNAMF